MTDYRDDLIKAQDRLIRKDEAIIATQKEIIAVQDAALEAERQWRLKSLPTLLAAEAKAARCVCQRDDVQAAPELTSANRP